MKNRELKLVKIHKYISLNEKGQLSEKDRCIQVLKEHLEQEKLNSMNLERKLAGIFFLFLEI